ncbi:MAG: alpha-hydroxy acid oxidase [Dehalococcoidia bacterium]
MSDTVSPVAYVNVSELEPLAREKLDPAIFDFIAGGAEDEVTLRRNSEAFQAIGLRPRVLVDVTTTDTSTSVLAQSLALPVMLAPVALHRLAHPDGELATARAAAYNGTVMILSTMSSRSIEEVAAAASGPKWFQLYCYRDKGVTERLVKRAESAGFQALCLTVDVPRLGRRERDLRRRLEFPADVIPVNFSREMDVNSIPSAAQGSAIAEYAARLMDPSLTWASIAWLKSVTSMPIVVKGILTAEDAELAVGAGVSAIVASNHGGRQLDGAPAGIEALPDVIQAVAGRVEVIVDGGVRRGTDILKALALGAKSVLIGRPYIWGLAVDGEQGVSNVLEMLKSELELAMALCGVTAIDQITPALVR